MRLSGQEMDSQLNELQVTDDETRADWRAWWRAMDDALFAHLAEKRKPNGVSSNPLS